MAVRTQSRLPRWMVALTMASRSASGTSATSPKSSSASLPASGPSVTCYGMQLLSQQSHRQ